MTLKGKINYAFLSLSDIQSLKMAVEEETIYDMDKENGTTNGTEIKVDETEKEKVETFVERRNGRSNKPPKMIVPMGKCWHHWSRMARKTLLAKRLVRWRDF